MISVDHRPKCLGIDASNIRRGGGVTHLVELLRAADPSAHGFGQVVVWSGAKTLDAIEDRPWLVKRHIGQLDQGLLSRTMWQRKSLSRCAREEGCDLLFVPGGSFAGDFAPIATLSQNLLPFEWRELWRFGWSLMTAKLLLLRLSQSRTFRRADGVLFLTRYAEQAVCKVIGTPRGKTAIVPHGIEQRFSLAPRPQAPVTAYSMDKPFRFVYVSIVDVYKHQDTVAKAMAGLRAEGLPVEISFIGPSYGPAEKKLRKVLAAVDPDGRFIHCTGPIPYSQVHEQYRNADACVFASSCENLPIILLEGMAAGLPIACSDRGPMPEVLKDAGVYFDPEDVQDVQVKLRQLVLDPDLRSRLSALSWAQTHDYSWRRCAGQTFDFFAGLA